MNTTIETILNHRSIRKFKDQPLTEEQIHTIVKAAQAASTSSFIQAYSIIGVTDQEKKEQLAKFAGGQSYVANTGHFFVFCADLYRHSLLGEFQDVDVLPSIESTEKFMVTIIDAALAAQNAALAAESMGLGICYIGGIRNSLEEVSEILETPDYVVPLFGLTVGVPDQTSSAKPRLPVSAIYHENTYKHDVEWNKNQLEQYDADISSYYENRTNGARKDKWTEQMASMLEKKSRLYMKDFVEKKKLNRL
ncbi:oxygen-insensitive NADPH nitroreductase [Jeotgalibacillus soli]|uniref:FMN reductase n=1 Tax=Jeotgalibacillus soli TaxID=889306 RepID=A0A0C2R8W5_9BACL|nr:oxygen-insensitive NADPH nitroreductase [Jeotgalibacillus soli]KIL46740.1 FMN reductase [Jeotgalibacillus soli]